MYLSHCKKLETVMQSAFELHLACKQTLDGMEREGKGKERGGPVCMPPILPFRPFPSFSDYENRRN